MDVRIYTMVVFMIMLTAEEIRKIVKYHSYMENRPSGDAFAITRTIERIVH